MYFKFHVGTMYSVHTIQKNSFANLKSYLIHQFEEKLIYRIFLENGRRKNNKKTEVKIKIITNSLFIH